MAFINKHQNFAIMLLENDAKSMVTAHVVKPQDKKEKEVKKAAKEAQDKHAIVFSDEESDSEDQMEEQANGYNQQQN